MSDEDKDRSASSARAKQRIAEIAQTLEKWQLCPARIAKYEASHSTLTIRLQRDYSNESLDIVCLGVCYIKMFDRLDDSSFAIEYRSTDSGLNFFLVDLRNELMIQCGSIVVQPNVETWERSNGGDLRG